MSAIETAYVLPAPMLFTAPRIDRELVADFFMGFARADFALKKAGYARPGTRGGIEIEWPRFARSIEPSFSKLASPSVENAITYLLHHPPHKQFLTSSRDLGWEELRRREKSDVEYLIRCITTVRNNLFHGAKELRRPLNERNSSLLKSCLALLIYVIGLEPAVMHAFEEVGREPVA